MAIITVSRQFGSGGREFAKRLATQLGYAYYDREIIRQMAKDISLDEKYLENILEKVGDAQYPIHYSRSFSFPTFSVNNQAVQLLASQHKLLKLLAQRGRCVIVGRASDIALASYAPLRIYVYAEEEARLQRCRAHSSPEEKLTDKQLRRKMKEIDTQRAQIYALVSNRDWGDKNNYDLCINTTNLSLSHLATVVAEYIRIQEKEAK